MNYTPLPKIKKTKCIYICRTLIPLYDADTDMIFLAGKVCTV
jgi:hypothetical protein